MAKPLVSIAMLSYNHEKFIAQSLESVLMQLTNFSFEIIIGEDCSTDSTRLIIQKYENIFPAIIKPIYHKSNVGFMKNWIEYVLPACSGEYIALLESDDYWLDPNKLQKQVDFLTSNMGFSICGHWTKNVDSEDHLLEKPIFSGENCPRIFSIKDAYKGTALHTSSWLFRATCLNELKNNIKVYSTLPHGDDPLLLLALKGGKGFCFEEYMGVYRIHSGGAWTSEGMVNRGINMLKYYYSIPLLIDSYDHKVLRSTIRHGKNSLAWAARSTSDISILKSSIINLWHNPFIPKYAVGDVIIRTLVMKLIGKRVLRKIKRILELSNV